MLNLPRGLRNELQSIWLEKNGFWAFESALRFFPAISCENSIGIMEWNARELWINDYNGLADNCLFFAEDAFGNQFCIRDDIIFSFDAETGELEKVSESFEGWCQAILSDYDYWTGYSLVHDWQLTNGKLESCNRLMPKIPFVCGGEFNLANLAPIKAVSGMRSRGNLAHQIENLSDGGQIEFQIIE